MKLDPNLWDHVGELTPLVADVLRQFPPLCRVIARKRLIIPSPGRVGRVVSYIQRSESMVTLVVRDEDALLGRGGPQDAAECLPHWIMPVQYDGNKTPEWVERSLRGEQEDPTDPLAHGKIEGPMASGDPQLVVLRLDNGQPAVVHPDRVLVDGNELFLLGETTKVPVTYAMQAVELWA